MAADGSSNGTFALPEAFATVRSGAGVLFQAFTAERANARQANAATRNRTRVKGGGAKPWRQKGTGRARQGSTRSPHWRHGAVVFGPNGRKFKQRIPDKMRKLAFSEAFATRAAEGRVLVFESLPTADKGRLRTRTVVDWLARVGDTGSALFVTSNMSEGTGRALANLQHVGLATPGALKLSEILAFDTLLVDRPALDALAQRATA
ncbi:MAG: 50S ribosomal protein L4 [Chloroflexi bacterium]|nr:50S ribosomal protein L4 [Chloroflexota bacterium]